MTCVSLDGRSERRAGRRLLAAAGVASALSGVVRLLRAWRVRARERSAAAVLYALPDHTLKDIGVHRTQIRHVARTVAENPEADYRNLRL